MPTLRFEGYSDDTFGEYGHTNDDYDNCASSSTATPPTSAASAAPAGPGGGDRGRRTTPAQIFHSTPEGSGILTVAQWAAAHRTMQNQRCAAFFDPSMGEPWEGTDEAHEDGC
jgi:hypothetical protein